MSFPSFSSPSPPPRLFLDSPLPPYCEPSNRLLHLVSSAFGTCIPTNLALLSTSLGILSIVSWLFAQLPQIYKNHALKSTSGLSIFFLAEWFLGDFSNLAGSALTGQAAWQVALATYYCAVDLVLLGQWIYYERLGHGRPMKRVWTSRLRDSDTDTFSDASSIFSVNSVASSSSSIPSYGAIKGDGGGGGGGSSTDPDKGIAIPAAQRPLLSSSPRNTYLDSVTLSRSPSVKEPGSYRGGARTPPPFPTPRGPPGTGPGTGTTPPRAPAFRLPPGGNTSPMPSPKSFLYLALLLSVLAQAAPSPSSHTLDNHSPRPPLLPTEPWSASVGRLVSWLSTVLYLGSRLPQLIKNARRRSTAGLSPTLFAAAFFGNLFYSSSLLANPCAWRSFPASPRPELNGSRGWVGPGGSARGEWLGRAAPFFLGAAGVLAMDAAVGVQFWMFAREEREEMASADQWGDARREIVVVAVPASAPPSLPPSPPLPPTAQQLPPASPLRLQVPGGGAGGAAPPSAKKKAHRSCRPRRRWRRVEGWMRGWMPTASAAGTPRLPRSPEEADQRSAWERVVTSPGVGGRKNWHWPVPGEETGPGGPEGGTRDRERERLLGGGDVGVEREGGGGGGGGGGEGGAATGKRPSYGGV